MTNQDFRVKTLGLFAKAEFINENNFLCVIKNFKKESI